MLGGGPALDARHDITSPQRIVRILQRVCQATLTVLIRLPAQPTVAVKGKASFLDMDADPPQLHITDVSEKGLQYLAGQRRIQVEFAMVSAKVVFTTDLIAMTQGKLIVSIPRSISNIERRQNIRHAIPPDLPAFFVPSIWKPTFRNDAEPAHFAYQRDLVHYIRLADISQTGFCGTMRFPAALAHLAEGAMDRRAQLVLPLETPHPIEIEVRWTKRLRTGEQRADGKTLSARSYRFGAAFVSPSEEFNIAMKQYLQRIAQLNAI